MVTAFAAMATSVEDTAGPIAVGNQLNRALLRAEYERGRQLRRPPAIGDRHNKRAKPDPSVDWDLLPPRLLSAGCGYPDVACG